MEIIPLQQVPSQTLNVYLNNQNCKISIFQKSNGLFFSLNVDNVDYIDGVIALNLVSLVPNKYNGFIGNLFFYDILGTSDPDYSGLGSRWLLIYNEQY